MPLLPIEFIVPTNITIVEKDKNWMNALLVQMENLVLLEEKRIIAKNFFIIFRNLKNIKVMTKKNENIWRWRIGVMAPKRSKNQKRKI